MQIVPPLTVFVVTAALAACGDDFQLPPARATNILGTASLYALTGTPVGTPSGYQLEFRREVRTDQTTAFDFAFDITPAGEPVFLPTGPLGLGEASGLMISPEPFDSIEVAPNSGYVYDSSTTAAVGAELLVQSRVTTCSYGGTASYYAKLRVLAVDSSQRRVDFEILVNINCGYRGLEPGLPTR
jgi:hypothetical protein